MPRRASVTMQPECREHIVTSSCLGNSCFERGRMRPRVEHPEALRSSSRAAHRSSLAGDIFATSRAFPGHIDMRWSELKTVVRGLIRAPWLSGAAVGALVLGIGPNTAIFSIVYATLFAPLPYASPEQLVRVTPMVGNGQDRALAAEYFE